MQAQAALSLQALSVLHPLTAQGRCRKYGSPTIVESPLLDPFPLMRQAEYFPSDVRQQPTFELPVPYRANHFRLRGAFRFGSRVVRPLVCCLDHWLLLVVITRAGITIANMVRFLGDRSLENVFDGVKRAWSGQVNRPCDEAATEREWRAMDMVKEYNMRG